MSNINIHIPQKIMQLQDNQMEFIKIEANDFERVIEHLRKTFFSDEPLNKAVNLCLPGEGHYELEKHSLSTLRDGLSVMAVSDDNEIAGVILNASVAVGDAERSIEKIELIDDERFKKIFKLLHEQNIRLDLFERFNVSKIFDIRILSVDPKFRCQGIAKNLMLKSEKMALENGFKVLKIDATGYFSQRISSSMNFDTLSEVLYDNYLNDAGLPIFRVPPPHEKFKIMFKVLN